MEEEDYWRRTAWEAMGQNVTDNTMWNGALQAIDVAQSHLARAAEVCGRYRAEVPYHPALAGDALPRLPDAMDHIKIANFCARQVSISHAGSGHVFSRCTARVGVGLQNSAPVTWQMWQGHHNAAAAHGAMALQGLQSAWSHGAAASDAVFVMLWRAPVRMCSITLLGIGRPHAAHQLLDRDYEHSLAMALPWGPIPRQGFPLWDAWGHATEQLLRRAAAELAMTRAALHHMRRAVSAEFFEANWMIHCRAAT